MPRAFPNQAAFSRLIHPDPATNRIVQDLYDKLSQIMGSAGAAVAAVSNPVSQILSTGSGSGGGSASVLTGDVTAGSDGVATVVGLRGRPLLSTAPAGTNVLTWNGTAWAPAAASSGFANPMTTLGDLIYENATPVPDRLVGDTSNTRKFLRTLSVAGVAQAPAWDVLSASDIPDPGAYAYDYHINQTAGYGPINLQHASAIVPAGQYILSSYMSGVASPTNMTVNAAYAWTDERGYAWTVSYPLTIVTGTYCARNVTVIRTNGSTNVTVTTTISAGAGTYDCSSVLTRVL